MRKWLTFLAVSSLAVLACAEIQQPEQAGSPSLKRAHGEQEGFFFLPPLADGGPTAPNNPDFLPFLRVSVCEWDGEGCGNILVEFTADDATNPLVLEDDLYKAELETRDLGIVPGGDYRVAVYADELLLGLTELLFSEPGRNRSGGSFAIGRTIPLKFRMAGEIPGAAVIGEDGGTVTTGIGVTVEVPAGALPPGVLLTVDTLENVSVDDDIPGLSPILSFNTSGDVPLDAPVSVSVPLSDANATPVVAQVFTDLDAMFPFEADIDVSGGVATFQLDGFSDYWIIQDVWTRLAARSEPYTYRVNNVPANATPVDEYLADIRRAFDLWENFFSEFSFVWGQEDILDPTRADFEIDFGETERFRSADEASENDCGIGILGAAGLRVSRLSRLMYLNENVEWSSLDRIRDPNVCVEAVQGVMEHEIGHHVLGPGHSSELIGLMAVQGNGIPGAFTELDVRWINETRGTDMPTERGIGSFRLIDEPAGSLAVGLVTTRMSVEVLDRNDYPMPGVTVYFYADNEDSELFGTNWAQTNEDGIASFQGDWVTYNECSDVTFNARLGTGFIADAYFGMTECTPDPPSEGEVLDLSDYCVESPPDNYRDWTGTRPHVLLTCDRNPSNFRRRNAGADQS